MAISITKPTVGGSEDTWGTTINTALDTIVDEINDNADGTNAISPNLTEGVFQIGGTAVTSTAAEINKLDGFTGTATDLNEAVAHYVPTGGIIMWSGSVASIPTGWVICDGTNSTPDLRNRFVVGAGDTYAVDATGGSADAIVVSHTHTVTDSGHTHSVAQSFNNGGDGYGDGISDTSNAHTFVSTVNTTTTGSSTTGISIDSTGSSGTNANLPPYYALAYIMKT